MICQIDIALKCRQTPLITIAHSGAPGRIRTHDPLVRSQVLYPTELRAHIAFSMQEIIYLSAYYFILQPSQEMAPDVSGELCMMLHSGVFVKNPAISPGSARFLHSTQIDYSCAGFFESLRCSVLRCIFSTLAVTEILLSFSMRIRCMYSHSSRSTESG